MRYNLPLVLLVHILHPSFFLLPYVIMAPIGKAHDQVPDQLIPLNVAFNNGGHQFEQVGASLIELPLNNNRTFYVEMAVNHNGTIRRVVWTVFADDSADCSAWATVDQNGWRAGGSQESDHTTTCRALMAVILNAAIDLDGLYAEMVDEYDLDINLDITQTHAWAAMTNPGYDFGQGVYEQDYLEM